MMLFNLRAEHRELQALLQIDERAETIRGILRVFLFHLTQQSQFVQRNSKLLILSV